ncbi:hypothetical protein BN2497_13849 [Janthinobacterium sp. CG23_2]|nr:hypothetical protein BN2497_13849 [Janthinobacterium sp. CG23_2]CUU33322.1 hypothetical protein BN3177_13849 [Janthinobacterium sp. CG23_2]
MQTQNLVGNESLIMQTGSDNQATVRQTGITGLGLAPNTAYVSQGGDGCVAQLTQTGAMNRAGVNQY